MLFNLQEEMLNQIGPSLLCVLTVGIYIIYTDFITKSKLNSTSVTKNGTMRDREQNKVLQEVPKLPLWRSLYHMSMYGEWRSTSFLKILPTYNPLVEVKMLSNRYIFINDYKLGKELFKNPAINGRLKNYLFNFPAQGKYGMTGLLSSSGSEWKDQRKFIHSHLKQFGFGTKKMEAMIQEEVNVLLDSWAEFNGKSFSPNKHFYRPVVNSLWISLTGRRASVDDTELMGLIESVYAAFQNANKIPNYSLGMLNLRESTLQDLIDWLPLPVFREIQEFYKSFINLRLYLRGIIQDRIKSGDNTGDQGPSPSTDLVDAYLTKIENTEDTKSVFFGKTGEMNLLAAMVEFFVAGGDTTAHMLSWSMLHLIRNPKMQEKIWTEIKSVVGADRYPCLADRPYCPYLEAFLCEVLRMNPVVSAAHPHEATEDTELGPYSIKKGTGLILNIYGIHHDPKIWGDPETFRPERFLSLDGSTVLKHEAMLAFGFGPRRCIGEQSARDHLFLFVSSVVQRFTLQAEPTLTELLPVKDTKTGMHSSQVFNMVACPRL